MQTQPRFSVTAAKYIREICKPIRKIGLTNFMHDITFGKGEISMLVSNEQVFQFYHHHKIPTICTNETGRILEPGLYLNKILESNYKDCAVLMPLLPKIGQQFKQNYGQHSVHIATKENDCQHFYSLFFDLSEKHFLHWIVNNGNFLKDLIENYNFKSRDIILEAKIKENRITLPSYHEFLNHDASNTLTTRLGVIHKLTNMPIHLSRQQSRCLLLLLQGKSAKHISLDMKLSHRTVEHYLENIRKLLGCASNKELVISYYEQLVDEIKQRS